MSIKRTTVEERKGMPLASGFLDYFPDAMLVVAEVSRIGNEQHHPGEPLHWDKSKSQDEADALLRHLLDRGTLDTDGVRHTAKVAWRAMALLQRELDAEAGLLLTKEQACGKSMASSWSSFAAGEGLLARYNIDATIESRGEWPSDTRVGGLLTCCGQSEHAVDCPQWR